MADHVVPDKRTEAQEGRVVDGDAVPQGLALPRRATDAVDALQCLCVRREITTRFIGSENSCARMRRRRQRRSVLPSAVSSRASLRL